MKKITLSFFAVITSFVLSAQYCGGSGSSVCTPGGPYPALGFYPSYDSVACAQIGVAYDQKIDIQIPATVVYLGAPRTLNWVRIDSVENLPCGLCWRSSNSNNQFNGNSTGCVRITGTTYDAPGQYKLRIRLTANANVGINVTLSNQDAESFGVKYWARVENLDSTCISVDTLAAGRQKTNSGSAPTPAIAGTTSICSGGNTTLSLTNAASFYAYKWSNNATTSSISVNAAGTYSVTAYAACSSATASVNVTSTSATPAIAANGPLTFCSGGNVTLDAGPGFTSYQWSNGATTQTITVNSSNTYGVTVSQGNCTGTDSEVVTVTSNNLNPIILPAGTLNICPGGNVTLDAGSGYSSYLWSDNSTSQTLDVNSQGTYTVTVTQGSCSGTASQTVNVGNFPLTVNVTPAGPVSFCAGGNTTLDAGAGFDAYNWSNTDQTQSITVSSGGSYIVTVQKDGCVGKDTVEVIVNSNPNPTITPTGNQGICDGKTAQLAVQNTFSSYAWSNNSTTSSIVVSNSGSYNVTVTDNNGCSGSAANAVSVTVNPNPLSAVTLNQVGSSNDYWLEALPSSGVTYQWQYAINQDTTTGQFLTFSIDNDSLDVDCSTQGGYWRVAVTDANGCVDTSGYASVPVCVGINDVSSDLHFSMMPNPASNVVYISYNISEPSETVIEMLDVQGRVTKSVTSGTQAEGRHSLDINVSDMPKGVYFVRFTANKYVFTEKLMVE